MDPRQLGVLTSRNSSPWNLQIVSKKKQISSWFFSYARDVNSTNQLINSTLNRELFFNSILFSPRSDIVLPRRILLIFVRLCLYIDIIGMFRYLH